MGNGDAYHTTDNLYSLVRVIPCSSTDSVAYICNLTNHCHLIVSPIALAEAVAHAVAQTLAVAQVAIAKTLAIAQHASAKTLAVAHTVAKTLAVADAGIAETLAVTQVAVAKTLSVAHAISQTLAVAHAAIAQTLAVAVSGCAIAIAGVAEARVAVAQTSSTKSVASGAVSSSGSADSVSVAVPGLVAVGTSVVGVPGLVTLPCLVPPALLLAGVGGLGGGSGVLPAVGGFVPVGLLRVLGGGGGARSPGVTAVSVSAVPPLVGVGGLSPVLSGGGVEAEDVVLVLAVVLEALPVVAALALVGVVPVVDFLVVRAVAQALPVGVLLPQVLVQAGAGGVLVPGVGLSGAGGVGVTGGLSTLAGPVGGALVAGGSLGGAVVSTVAVVEPLVAVEGGLGGVGGGGIVPLTEAGLACLVPRLGGSRGSLAVHGLGQVTSDSGQTVAVHAFAVHARAISVDALAVNSRAIAVGALAVNSRAIAVGALAVNSRAISVHARAVAVHGGAVTVSGRLGSRSRLTSVVAVPGSQVVVDVVGGAASVVPDAVGALALVQLVGPVPVAAVGGGGVGGVAVVTVPVGSSGGSVLGPGGLLVGLGGVGGGGPGGLVVHLAVVGGGAVPQVVQGVGVGALAGLVTTVHGVPQVEALVVSVVDAVVAAATLSSRENGGEMLAGFVRTRVPLTHCGRLTI